MERRNYFEILGLDFDPQYSKSDYDKKIENAIKEWKERTENLLANESVDVRRSALSAELNLHDDMVRVMSDGKTRNAEARALKEQRTAQLEKLLDIMLVGISGTPEMTNAQIRDDRSKLGLSPDAIKKIYEKKGFKLRSKTVGCKLDDYFLSSTQQRTLNELLLRLKETFNKEVNQQQFYPWVKNVVDLYSLACFKSGDNDVAKYKSKPAKDLCSIMEAGVQEFVTTPNNVLLKTLSDLFAFGEAQVFNSENNRKKYDQSLKLETLQPLFDLLKSAPDNFKKDSYFAENNIKTIRKCFPDYNLSLAIYNQEAGLALDPYEPTVALIHVTCARCNSPMEFRTREEAENGKCAVCGAALYVTCPNPKCHKKVPASAEWCSCGFHISEMRFFDEYLRAAELALREADLPEARRQLANAENASPGHPKLISLRKRINDETAKKMMPDPAAPMSERANRCVEILKIVKDYQPAIDMLRLCRPNAPLNLHGAVNNKIPLICTLTWGASQDMGVSYWVVRKENGIPRTHSDGKIIAANLNSLEFKDDSIRAGTNYVYAVFAHRAGVYSDPVICIIETLCELALSASPGNGVCRFSWAQPANCIGVRILRSVNAIPSRVPGGSSSVIAERARLLFDDRDVENNKTYGYRLQCVYPFGNGFKYSEGCTVMLTPRQPSVEKCEIDKAKTRIEGNRLIIILQKRHKNLEKIHYIVAHKVDSKVPWATTGDAERGRLNVITVQDYERDGMILIESPPKTDLYISVIGQYKMPDGSVVYSDVSKYRISNKPKQMITYRLNWGSELFSSKPKPKGCKLYVTTSAEDTPTLKLVYRADGHIPMNLLDPQTLVLHTIPESDEGFRTGTYVYTFPDSTWDNIKPNTQLRLMLFDEDMTEYEVLPENISSLYVPPK